MTVDATAGLRPTQVSLNARGVLAVANALMALVVGTYTAGLGVGILAALVLGLLPLTPYLLALAGTVALWMIANPFGGLLGVFLLAWIVGGITWGLPFAFAVALVLVPVVGLSIVAFTLRPGGAVD